MCRLRGTLHRPSTETGQCIHQMHSIRVNGREGWSAQEFPLKVQKTGKQSYNRPCVYTGNLVKADSHDVVPSSATSGKVWEIIHGKQRHPLPSVRSGAHPISPVKQATFLLKMSHPMYWQGLPSLHIGQHSCSFSLETQKCVSGLCNYELYPPVQISKPGVSKCR